MNTDVLNINETTLAIPLPTDEAAIKWRIGYVKQHLVPRFGTATNEIFEIYETSKSFSQLMSKQKTDSFLKELFETSQLLNLDEVELALLLGATHLEFFNKLTPESQTHIKTNLFSSYFNSTPVDQIENLSSQPIEFLISDRLKTYKAKYLPTIRAKLALLELFASLAIPEAIARLISIRTKYIENSIVQQWLYFHLCQYKYDQEQECVENSEELLELFWSKIKGDKRKIKTRRYKYWQSFFRYELLVKVIKICRNDLANQTEQIQILKDMYQINLSNDLILSKSPASELAFDIMQAEGLIENSNSFRDYQGTLNKLKALHPELIEDTYIQNYLDYQYNYPKSFASADLWLVLNNL